MTATSEDEQFVALTTALESLLIADEERVSITQSLADGVAALLGKGFEDRRKIRKTVKDLYEKRCSIVHEGLPVSSKSLDLLSYIALHTIWEFVRREAPQSSRARTSEQ